MNSTEQIVVDLTPLQAMSFKNRTIIPSSNEDFPPFMIFPDHTFREGPRGGERLMNIIFYGEPPNYNILHERFGIEYIIPSNRSNSELVVVIPRSTSIEKVVTTMKKVNAINKKKPSSTDF